MATAARALEMNMDLLKKINSFFISDLGLTLFDKTADLIAGITPLFSLGFSIYILTLCFVYYNRGLDDSAVDIFKGLVGWLLVIALAFGVEGGNYAWLAKGIYTLPETLSGWLSGSEINPDLFESYLTSYAQMDLAFEKYIGTLDRWDISEKLTAYVASLTNNLVGSIILVVAWLFYLLAKLDLALVLMVGPLFLGAMLFPSTRQYGMNWIGQILNYSIVIGLYTVLFLVLLTLFETILADTVAGANKGVKSVTQILDALRITLLMGLIMILALLKIPSIAAALTGGAQFASGVGQAVGAAMTAKSLGMSRSLNKMMSNSIKKR